ncbi:hypothetical protein Tco_1428025 [Tanacetum coccineum]
MNRYGYYSVGRFDVFFRNQLLVFQQHQNESLYDSWTRFKDIIRKVPNHGLSIWTLIEIFLKHLDSLSRHITNLTAKGDLRKFSDIGVCYAIEDYAQYDKKCSNPTSAIYDETIANTNAQIVGDDMVRVQVPRCMAWLDYDEHVDSLSTMDNEVGVTSPKSTTQTLPSAEEYTPPVTYPEEVKETLGTLMEVEPLDKTQLEDLGLNTCNHDIPLSSREVSSFDEPKPQPKPLANFPTLDVSLGDERGPQPPIKPHSLDSFRMKVVDYLTTQTPHSPHVANSHPKGVYSYYNPGIDAFDGLNGTERRYQEPCLGEIIMGELLSLDRVFDFLMDEPELHPAYDFLAPGPLPEYAGNPNNNNGWIEVDVPLLGELGAAADELMVGPLVDETNEPIVKAEKQVVAPVIDMEEDIAMLFGDGDFSDEDFEGFEDEEEVWEVNEELLMALVTPPPMPVVAPPSTYKVGGPSTAAAEGQSFPIPTPELLVPLSVIKDLITRMGNLKYGHGQLVKNVIQVSDAKVADDITIGEIGSRVSAIEGQVQVMASKMVQAEDGLEQAAVQQRDSQIQQLQTMVSKMCSRESTLMQCIIWMDRGLADLERRPPGPQ